MSPVHIVRNQDGHYWGRGKRWVDGRESAKVLTYDFRDEAVNTVFELSSKNIELRCEVMDLSFEDNKLPKLSVSDIPLPDDADDEQGLEIDTTAPMSSEETTAPMEAQS